MRPGVLAATAAEAGVTGSDVSLAAAALHASASATSSFAARTKISTQRRACRCRAVLVTERHVATRGPVVLLTEGTQAIAHLPDCIFVKSEPPSTTKSYKLGWRFGDRRAYMTSVVALALSFSSLGRGQWSVSPTIQAFNYIELRESPLYKLLQWAIRQRRENPTIDRLPRVLRDRVEKYRALSLKALIRDGKASPRDVDFQTGSTVLHWAMTTGLFAHGFVLDTLRELGIPNDVKDQEGQ